MEKSFPFLVICATGLMRLIPHISNFSPLYGGVNYFYSKNKNAVLSTLITLLVIYLSDLAIALVYKKEGEELYPFYGWWLLYIYPLHVMNGFISRMIVKRPEQYVNIGVTCLITSLNFFVVSNFGYFLLETEDHSTRGLQKVYIDAIPFFSMQILSNLAFSALFFALDYFLFRNNHISAEKVDQENRSAEVLLINSDQ